MPTTLQKVDEGIASGLAFLKKSVTAPLRSNPTADPGPIVAYDDRRMFMTGNYPPLVAVKVTQASYFGTTSTMDSAGVTFEKVTTLRGTL